MLLKYLFCVRNKVAMILFHLLSIYVNDSSETCYLFLTQGLARNELTLLKYFTKVFITKHKLQATIL
jgi:hypothetical protein